MKMSFAHWQRKKLNNFQVKIKEIDRQIKETKNAGKYAFTLKEKLNCISQIKSLEKLRLETRRKQIEKDFEKI